MAELDRAKTAFFSNVSHEFRTPLTLMLGPAEDALAAADDLSPDERERWSLVHRNALRLSRMVNTLLDFSRIEAGRVEASFEPTDLGALTGELASMFRSAIDRGGLRLRLDLPALEEPAYVDRDMWEKIVLNLLSNALKFTFDGEISVSLRRQGADFELVVQDTGIGIAPGELRQVFDRFHRIKGARARTHEGTGIGLALVAELAKLHRRTGGGRERSGAGDDLLRPPAARPGPPAGRPDRRRPHPALDVDRHVAALRRERRCAGPPPTSGSSISASRSARGSRSGECRPRARIVLADDNADMRDYYQTRLLRERWNVEAVPEQGGGLGGHRAGAARPRPVRRDDAPGLDG